MLLWSFLTPVGGIFTARLVMPRCGGHSKGSVFKEGWLKAVKPYHFPFVLGGCLLIFVLMIDNSKLYGQNCVDDDIFSPPFVTQHFDDKKLKFSDKRVFVTKSVTEISSDRSFRT